jgi:UDP-N-acetylglucosamine kinase
MTEEEKRISDEAINYVKANKKSIIDQFARLELYQPDANPVSVYMAGSPGAGKTEFSKSLINIVANGKPVVRIDADEIRESLTQFYNGANSYVVQGACGLAVDKIHEFALDHKQNFILDGTFAYFNKSYENINRSIRRNRFVSIYYLFQDPLVAWEFTKKREKLEGRHVPKEVFIDSLLKARENVNKIKQEFGDKIELNLVIKNFSNATEKFEINIESIDPYLDKLYNINDLERIII